MSDTKLDIFRREATLQQATPRRPRASEPFDVSLTMCSSARCTSPGATSVCKRGSPLACTAQRHSWLQQQKRRQQSSTINRAGHT